MTEPPQREGELGTTAAEEWEEPTSAAHLIIRLTPLNEGISGTRPAAEPTVAAAEMTITAAQADVEVSDVATPVQKDAAYYDEVRQAVGRGAPTLLLGSSTRSLKRSVERLRSARQT